MGHSLFLLGHPVVELLIHFPALPVMDGLADGGALGGALLHRDGLALLVDDGVILLVVLVVHTFALLLSLALVLVDGLLQRLLEGLHSFL